MRRIGEVSALDPFGVPGSEDAFTDKVDVLGGLIDTFTVTDPPLMRDADAAGALSSGP